MLSLQTQRFGCGPRHPDGDWKSVQKGATRAAKKAAKGTAEKVGKKLSEAVVEKGSDKIQQLLRKRRSKTTPRIAPAKSKETPRDDAMLKLSQILANQL